MVSKPHLFPLFVIGFTLCLCAGHAEHTHVSDPPYWDLLIFTQHWPVTVCQEWKEISESHTCAFPTKRDAWTIHGIWPTRAGTIGPAYCNRTWRFEPEEVKPIETSLNQLWINIEKDTSTYALWAHEWNKHGTCAAVLKPLNSQLRYFNMGLTWLQQYTMSDILKAAGIVPSVDTEYRLVDIHDAIRSKLGVDPIIECRREHGHNYIFELRICFNRDLVLANCDGITTAQPVSINDHLTIITNCDTSKGVLYPPTVPKHSRNSLYVQLYKIVTWLQWFTL